VNAHDCVHGLLYAHANAHDCVHVNARDVHHAYDHVRVNVVIVSLKNPHNLLLNINKLTLA